MSFGPLNDEIGCQKISDYHNYITKREVLAHFRAVCAEDLVGVSKAFVTKDGISLTADAVLRVFGNMGHTAVTKKSVVA